MSTKNFLEISSLRAAKEVRFATQKDRIIWHTSSKRLKYNLDGALLKCFQMVSLSFS